MGCRTVEGVGCVIEFAVAIYFLNKDVEQLLQVRCRCTCLYWSRGSVLPSYMECRDKMRVAVAIYFLNKDVEQLLQVCG